MSGACALLRGDGRVLGTCAGQCADAIVEGFCKRRPPMTHNLTKNRTFEKAASVDFLPLKPIICQGASVAASVAAEELREGFFASQSSSEKHRCINK